ncbi:MAG TPA: HAMP domain-containing protein, partial [Streptosporangiaceae bacterium]|nr:HAMP domain-containing protein [Streptosporangiaceae bacterium]
MSAPARPAHGPWQAARRLSDRTPMRVKLITAVLALVAIALATISIAGLGVLRNYLIGNVDSQLDVLVAQGQSPAGTVPSDIGTYLTHDRNRPYHGSAGVPLVIGWIPAGGSLRWVLQETRGYTTFSPSSGGGLSTSSETAVPLPAVSPGAGWLSDNAKTTVGSVSGNYRYRAVAVAGFASADGGTLNGTAIVALDVTDIYKTLGRLTAIDIIISSILLAGIAVLGVAVIRASMRPLTDIEKTAEAIAAGELSRRVPNHDPRTEIGRLGRSLNQMLAQIEAAFQARSASELAARKSEDKMRQFVADASHELR